MQYKNCVIFLAAVIQSDTYRYQKYLSTYTLTRYTSA